MTKRFVSLLDVPQERLAPSSVLAGLRAVHPAAELVHLTGDRWVLATLDGHDALRRHGARVLDTTRRAAATYCAKHPDVDPRSVDRITVGLTIARLKALGARFVGMYTSAQPDSAIALDFQRADFLARHDTEADFWRAYDAPQDAERAAALRDLTDAGRAHDAWRHAFTLSHTPGISTTASRQAQYQPRAGRTLIKSIA